jgi:hypothetical protein
VRGFNGDFTLRQFPGKRFGKRRARIAASGDPHGMVNIRAAGKRIAYRAAQTRGGAAERLNLGRMVVRLVLEHDQPVLFTPIVKLRFDDDTAGVDLVGYLKIIQNALHP